MRGVSAALTTSRLCRNCALRQPQPRHYITTVNRRDEKSADEILTTTFRKAPSAPTSSSAANSIHRSGSEPGQRPIRFTDKAYHPTQIPMTTSPDSSALESPTPKVNLIRPTKSRLRPRKAAMTLTSSAVERLKHLLELPDPKFIRVGVKNRGCSGLAYNLEYVDRPGTFDETVQQDGVIVLVDSKALLSIIGSEMDWIEESLEQRFIFRNPNIKEQCGCGESFMV